jgi:hypothetical protein
MPKEQASPGDARAVRRAPRIIAFAVAVLVLAAAAWLVVARARTQVRWTAVMEAANATSTINGVATLSGEDGTEWAYSLWSQVEGPGAFSPRGMLVAVKAPQAAKPSDLILRLTDAVDYCARDGVAASLAARRLSSRGRWARWGGRRALEVTVRASEVPGRTEKSPDEWRFYLDPRTRLVQGLEILDRGVLRAHVEYRYNQPLPSGTGNGRESKAENRE